jgi:hypothetical protein
VTDQLQRPPAYSTTITSRSGYVAKVILTSLTTWRENPLGEEISTFSTAMTVEMT